MRALSRCVILGISVLSAGATPTAPAVPQESEALIEKGVALRERGNDLEALEVFRRAYALARSARALAQVGLAEQALGRWVEAEADLKAALLEKSDKWIASNRGPLEEALKTVESRLGSIEVLGNPVGATVIANGKRVGELPLPGPLRVAAGTVALEVTAFGHSPLSRTVMVPAGSLARESVELGKSVDLNAQATVPKGPSGVVTARPDARSGGGSTESTLAWAAGGGAGIGLVGGVALLLIRNGHISSYNDDRVCLAGGRTRDENCRNEIDAAHSTETWMAISFGAGAILAAASVTLFALNTEEAPTPLAAWADDQGTTARHRSPAAHPGADERDATPSGLSLACGPTAANTFGLSCIARFE